MGLGKTYSTKYLIDSNNNRGVEGQVLSTTSTGIDWADANTLPGAGLWLESGNDIYNSNSGNVGIGTTSPYLKFHVAGDTRVQGNLMVGDASASNTPTAAIHIKSSGVNAKLRIEDSDSVNQYWDFLVDQGNALYFNEDTDTRVTFKEGGNVGIGTTSPDFKLQIATPGITSGSTYSWPFDLTRAGISSTRGFSIGVGVAGGNVALGNHNGDMSLGQTFGVDSNNLPVFYETMRISHDGTASSGKVGIGTTSPGEKLEVSGNIKMTETAAATDTDKFLVSDSGVIKYRTGAEVRTDIGAIGGSGGTNYIPMFTSNGTTLGNSQMFQENIGTGGAKRVTVSSRMTISGDGGDANGGTLNLSSNSARLGIALPSSVNGGEPEASLDVGKNARVRGSLNVGPTTEQYLFVSTTGDTPVGYVKMGYYGSGVEWGTSTSTTRTPQYSTGFGSNGKVVEDARYYTFKISFASMSTIDTAPRVLIAQDEGPYTYIVEDFYVFQDNASVGNSAPTFNSDLRLDYEWTPAVGAVRTSTAWVVPQATMQAAVTRRTLMQGVSAGALSFSGGGLQEGSGTAYARASVILTASSVSNTSNPGDYYLRLKVKKVNINNDIINNTQTITIA
jgi:hypothetical protein